MRSAARWKNCSESNPPVCDVNRILPGNWPPAVPAQGNPRTLYPGLPQTSQARPSLVALAPTAYPLSPGCVGLVVISVARDFYAAFPVPYARDASAGSGSRNRPCWRTDGWGRGIPLRKKAQRARTMSMLLLDSTVKRSTPFLVTAVKSTGKIQFTSQTRKTQQKSTGGRP